MVIIAHLDIGFLAEKRTDNLNNQNYNYSYIVLIDIKSLPGLCSNGGALLN